MSTKVRHTWNVKDGEVGIEEMTVTYVQNADTNDIEEHYQRAKVTAVPVVGDLSEDGSPYYFNVEVLPFEEDDTQGHWSVDDGSEFTELIEDFKKRLNLN